TRCVRARGASGARPCTVGARTMCASGGNAYRRQHLAVVRLRLAVPFAYGLRGPARKAARLFTG
ncbi:hypothetical protein, partial [Streptomyces sp. NPDC005969]|uniref:hypothetical protein n=1 Tax=Streptomyces sp. NPDC005969 TaxID=3156722 RepID=UPI0033E3EB58